jgi:chitinase
VTTTEIAVWNVILPEETSDSIIYLTSSIQPPPFTITVTPYVFLLLCSPFQLDVPFS